MKIWQMKFLAILLVLSVFFMRFFAWPIFRLTLLTFRPQKRDKQVAPSGNQVLLEAFSSVFQLKLFWKLILMVWRAVLRGWRHPHCWPPTIAPHPAVPPPHHFCPFPSLPISPRCTPPPPPIAKNSNFILIFNFFNLFENVFSALGINEPPLGFCSRVLHSSSVSGMISTF